MSVFKMSNINVINVCIYLRNHAIPPLHRLLITLRFFATGDMAMSSGDFVGVSPAAAAYIISDVTLAIVSLRRIYIKMPTQAEQAAVISKFYGMARFPRVIGVVDGTHIRIRSPGEYLPFSLPLHHFTNNIY